MKFQTLPVRRRPAPHGIMRRLSAVTRNRKQRVAATANPADLEEDDSGSRISRALVIIFLIHIVAIALIFIHQRFLDGRPASHSASVTTAASNETTGTAVVTAGHDNVPRLSTGESPYIVKRGDNYARIAATLGVSEEDLRQINNKADICPGRLLKIPPKRIVAVDPPEVAAIRNHSSPEAQHSTTEPVDLTKVPKAQVVRNVKESAPAAKAGSGKSYVVQPGDSIWRIANRYKVTEEALLRANGIRDARKMKSGMTLVIPTT